jgi:hypothetical protein
MVEEGGDMSKFVIETAPQEEEQVVEDQVETQEEVTEEPEAKEEGVEEPVVDELVVSLGDEVIPEEEQHAPGWVKDLRVQNRKLARELRETRQKLNEQGAPTPTLGPKPTLEASDWDATKFEIALAEWFEAKKVDDEVKAKKTAEEETANKSWQDKLTGYTKAKTGLAVTDFADAEAVVLDTLSTTQQGIIVAGAKDPALLVYALGKNEAKARELAAINDPVQFAFAVARMEAQMKVNGKKPATTPETSVSGGGRPAGTGNAVLEKLRTEAAKTGDYTKLTAYKTRLKNKK